MVTHVGLLKTINDKTNAAVKTAAAFYASKHLIINL